MFSTTEVKTDYFESIEIFGKSLTLIRDWFFKVVAGIVAPLRLFIDPLGIEGY